MEIVDANYILRYLLHDIDDQYQIAAKIIENNQVYIPGEIIAETIFVLQKVYDISNVKISNTLTALLKYKNITCQKPDIIIEALNIFATNKLDYADTLLAAFNTSKNIKIHTFDKKLKSILKHR